MGHAQTTPQLKIAQPLFQCTAANGARLLFATLTEGGCAILRDEHVLEVFPNDADSVTRAINLYQQLTDAGEDDD